MDKKEELNNALCDIVTKITGSYKDKESGGYVTVLRGRLNKNFGNPEMAVCMDDLQAHLTAGGYKWEDKNGKTWVPIRLQAWANEKKEPEPNKAAKTDDFPDQEIPF